MKSDSLNLHFIDYHLIFVINYNFEAIKLKFYSTKHNL